MTSDYPGDQPPQYPSRQSRGPQQGSGWQSGYPGNPDYSGNLGNPGNRPNNPSRPYTPSTPQTQPDPYTAKSGEQKTPSSQRPRWLIPVIVAALVIVVFGGIAGVVYAIGQSALQASMDTATTFCNDLRAQKYTDAYSLLSSGYQAQITGKDFTAFNQVHDQLDGKVRQCGLAGLQNNAGFNLNLNPQSASFNAQITRNRSYTGEVSLVKQNGSWKIDSVEDSLQGSDVGGLTTGSQFCQALAAQDYAAVYAMFTPAYQQQIGSAENYANGLKAVFGDGQFQITGCQPQVDTYTVTAQDDAASVSGAFDIKVTTDAGALTVQVPFKIAFAKISGAWKISDLEVVQSQG